MGFKDYFHWGKTEAPVIEQRSETVAGDITVASWDSAFGAGGRVDALSIVHGCVRIRAETIAQLPLKLLEKNPDGQGHQPAISHPYYQLLTKTPNSRMSNYDFWHWVIVQLDYFGNAYIQKLTNSIGGVIELNPLNPVSVLMGIRENTGLPYYRFTMANPADKTAQSGTQYQEMEADQVIHIKGFSRNGVFGISPVHEFKTLYDQYASLENAGADIARQAARPSSVIKHAPTIKEDELNKFKAAWEQNFSRGNSGKTAFVPQTLTLEGYPEGLSAVEAEYVNQKTFNAQRIASDIFGIPQHMLGLNGGPTFASVEQMALEFITYTINPILTNIEQQLNKQLLDDSDTVYTKFSNKHLLRGDTQTRIQWYTFALQNGVLTPNQVLQSEDDGLQISPINGGDSYVRAVNYQKIDDSVKAPAPSTGSNAPVIHIHNSIPTSGATAPVSGSNNP